MIDISLLQSQLHLGLGCSTFGGSKSAKEAKLILNLAFEEGINYFDLARSYGYGNAEAIVGDFIHGKRDKVFICSKFGILPPDPSSVKVKLIGLARTVKRMVPGLSSVVRQSAAQSFSKTVFTPELAQKSLHDSLRALKTDYLDLFLLHECSTSDVMREDVAAYLEKERSAGKIRHWGGTFLADANLKELLNIKTNIDALQFSFVDHQTFLKQKTDSLRILFSVFSMAPRFSNQVGEGISVVLSKHNEFERSFLQACHDLERGVILASMSSKEHIRQNLSLMANYKNILIE
ncbi:aldo/keto reductase [Haliscomenobacter hydrossis]|uniref:Aldo/keto reductase n=1 Tax=Haliscomenobacter hydrossis (strain ATCC 27775 / DSM 1100 / LMG 10767 / O) TaxID=760192 RepID=F4L454_HALH1|nr:aldo/keto reductase [Haliscomenobacter hydrossis]AEE50752.1 aldo/keto reductase [Haliscomenobacter hydrossis DSM 1100]